MWARQTGFPFIDFFFAPENIQRISALYWLVDLSLFPDARLFFGDSG
jgi:hypothetical protein